jgi:hypothetical protein
MTSKHVKELLIGRFTFFNGYVGAVYEAPNLNAADVIAVKHGGKVQEYEIKVSKADLVGEMRCARVAKGLDDPSKYQRADYVEPDGTQFQMSPVVRRKYLKSQYTLSATKLTKHKLYLTGEGREGMNSYSFAPPKPFVPNTFYWCIPRSLLEICQQLNVGLPYGIYVFDMPMTSYAQKLIVKPARSLGGQGDRLYFELFNRACTLWQESRAEIAQLKRELARQEAKGFTVSKPEPDTQPA